MNNVFDYYYIKNNLPLFLTSSIITLLIIITLLVIGIKVIKKK